MMKDLVSGNSVIVELAGENSMQPADYVRMVKTVSFNTRNNKPVSDEAFLSFMVVCKSYGLCPIRKEIYAIDDGRGNFIYFAGIDGWIKIGNSHPMMDGFHFNESDQLVQMPGAKQLAPEWMEVVVYRKDRQHPVIIREYINEVFKPRGAHLDYPRTMLRNRTLTRGFRHAFGFALYEPEDAQIIREQWDQKNVSDIRQAQTPSLMLEAHPQKVDSSSDVTVDFDKHAVDGYLHKLRSRCLETGGWEAAVTVATKRLGEGSTAALYAQQWLEKAHAHAIAKAAETQSVAVESH